VRANLPLKCRELLQIDQCDCRAGGSIAMTDNGGYFIQPNGVLVLSFGERALTNLKLLHVH